MSDIKGQMFPMFPISPLMFRMRPKMFRMAPGVSLNGGPKNPTKSTSVSDVSDVSLLADQERRTSDAVNGRGPVCSQCGRPGGNEVFFSDGQTARLHRECEALYRLDEGHASGEVEKSADDAGAG